jgi:hypothetical protein
MRWLDNVQSDLKKMEVKGWKEEMRDREQWRLVVEAAKAHTERNNARCWGSGLLINGVRQPIAGRTENSDH